MRITLLVVAFLSFAAHAHTQLEPPDIGDTIEAFAPELGDIVIAQVDVVPPTPVVNTPVPTSSTIGNLFSQLLSPAGFYGLIATIGTAVFTVWKLNENWKRRVALAAYHAFHVVEDIAAETDTPLDNKAVPYLEALDNYFKANGWRAPKQGEKDQALLLAKQMNGEEKVREKVQANAIIAAQEALVAKAAAVPQSAS